MCKALASVPSAAKTNRMRVNIVAHNYNLNYFRGRSEGLLPHVLKPAQATQ